MDLESLATVGGFLASLVALGFTVALYVVGAITSKFDKEVEKLERHREHVNNELSKVRQDNAYLRGLLEGGAQPKLPEGGAQPKLLEGGDAKGASDTE
ncbi:MAG: hypothetical protein F4Y14_01370 [Acidobacteria bacterium]|nr:hypothetical protein [Acidobacteriota bacterium]